MIRRTQEGNALSPFAGFLVAFMTAVVIAFLLLGPPGAESRLPWPGVVRDVVLEHQAAAAAFNWADTPGQARTPGATLLLLPLLIVPPGLLTVFITAAACVSIGLIVAGSLRLVFLSPLAGLVLAVGVPATEAFMQGVFHGSTFPPIAAAIVWAWVFIAEGRVGAPSVLIAWAGVARLWPFLLLIPLWMRRQKALVSTTVMTSVLLTLFGLLLPGVTLEGSVASLIAGGSAWVGRGHNGSAAAWLSELGVIGVIIGMSATLCIYAIGLIRSIDLRSDIMWTLPLALVASPLTWLPYLLVLVPVGLNACRRMWSRLAVAAAFGIQLIAFRVFDDRMTIALTTTLIAMAVWIDNFQEPRQAGVAVRSRENSR